MFLFDEPLSQPGRRVAAGDARGVEVLATAIGDDGHLRDSRSGGSAGDGPTASPVMRDAKVLQVGSPMDIYDRPANAFVGHFVGSPGMSLVSGTLTSTNGWVRVKGERFLLGSRRRRRHGCLAPPQGRQARHCGRTSPRRWSFRSWSRRTTRRPRSSRSSRWAAKCWLTLLLDEDTRIKARAETTFAGQPGENIWIRPKPDRIRLFDGESQEAIE